MKSASEITDAPELNSAEPSSGAHAVDWPVRAIAMLVLCGLALLLGAVMFNEWLLALIDPEPPLSDSVVHGVRHAQLALTLGGATLLTLAAVIAHALPIRRAFTSRRVVLTTLTLLVLILPIFVAEVILRPWARFEPQSRLFQPDPALGWRMRPGAQEQWEGTTVRVNQHGLRGPLVPFERHGSQYRMLFLGDSVTFGEKVDDDSLTFPSLVENKLASAARPVQSINAGVSGYSPWQYYEYLAADGSRYQPDLVLVCFVLNDVTEMLELARFGGYWEGWQLSRSYSNVFQLALRRSSIVYFVNRLAARLRFGADTRTGAQHKEVLDVNTLVTYPQRDDVRQAWRSALESLAKIVDHCRARQFRLAIIAFPFTFQLTDGVENPSPQHTLQQFALEHAVSYLDLLPHMRKVCNNEQDDPCFFDHCHLTQHGHHMVADAIADFVRTAELDIVSDRVPSVEHYPDAPGDPP